MEDIKEKFRKMLNSNSYMKPKIEICSHLDECDVDFIDEPLYNVTECVGYIFTPKLIYVRAIFDENGKLIADEMGRGYNKNENKLIDIFQSNNYLI